MATDDEIRDEKVQHDITRAAVKVLALLFGKADKYEYLTGEEILPSDQKSVIEQAKFTFCPLGKDFVKKEKKLKTKEKSK